MQFVVVGNVKDGVVGAFPDDPPEVDPAAVTL